MLKNYFLIALRQLRKERMYAAVKIGGFALSIAACLLITLYILDELSYDTSWKEAGRLYRLTSEFRLDGRVETNADWPAPMAAALKDNFPEIEAVGRLMPHDLAGVTASNEIRRTDRQENTYAEHFTFADQSILDMLQVSMVYGDRAHALTGPMTMVITKKQADKFFPGENPVGKTMILNNDPKKTYTVTGVINDLPANSHIQYDFFLTLKEQAFWPGEQQTWGATNYYTYMLLKPGASPAKLQAHLPLIISRYYIPFLKQAGDKLADLLYQHARLFVQPISRIHLSTLDDELPHGDIRFVWLFAAVACFILLIASINFINLSTAKSANRAKEVGLRKVVGSLRSSLIQQFLMESMVFSFLSIALGVLLAWLILPWFNTLTAKSLTIPWEAWWLLPAILIAAVVIGILAGIYPALYLSAFMPIEVLKGRLSRGTKSAFLRNGLVVFQFTTSIMLIIGTLVIYGQMHFILNREPGFDKDQVVVIRGTGALTNDQVRTFRNELAGLPQVSSASVSDYLPVWGTRRDGNDFYLAGRNKIDLGINAQFWTVDDSYLKTLGMHLVAGRNFNSNMLTDSQNVIINQTMASQLHLKEPLGKKITNGWADLTVIGVIQDFNYESMRDNIRGLVMRPGLSSSIVSAKLHTKDTKGALAAIDKVWRKFAPAQPIRYTFLDENFAAMYADVQRTGGIFTSFALLAIVIACLGLFALSAFMAEQRYKEIGIRKVLGASVASITSLLSKDFILLVLLAFLIASPIAWWGMNKWLQDFAYRIHISVWVFVATALISMLIAFFTISFQSIKAAMTNPVKSLKSE